MKKMRTGIIFIAIALNAILANAAQVNVVITHDQSYTNTSLVSKMEANLSKVLTEINAAQESNRELKIVNMDMNDFATKSLAMLWSNIHFYCDDEEVVDRLWVFENGFMVRQIPLIITPEGEEFGSGTYQEAVVEFNNSGKITDFRLALDSQLSEGMERCGRVVETERRMKILS
ncbi:MAG: hypothetical protein LBL58_00095 [Tannerellaceae bacterium]|jgi:hypothetical protein|nr:hypothetical protein [Tannerellaceae bacterium]